MGHALEDAPRRLSAFHHLLEHLPIPKRIHGPPESLVLVRHKVPLLYQAIEWFDAPSSSPSRM